MVNDGDGGGKTVVLGFWLNVFFSLIKWVSWIVILLMSSF